jgi:hypothetical protein
MDRRLSANLRSVDSTGTCVCYFGLQIDHMKNKTVNNVHLVVVLFSLLLIIGRVFAGGEDDVPHPGLRHLAPSDKVTINIVLPNGKIKTITVSEKALSAFEKRDVIISDETLQCIPTTLGDTCVSDATQWENAVNEIESGSADHVIPFAMPIPSW